MSELALLGGTPAIQNEPKDYLFGWPIITEEDEEAALYVIRNNLYSGIEITEKFQEEFALWQGSKYAVAYCNGTLSLTAAMFAIGLGMGDEIICPTKTYWASITQAMQFGATPVFCNIDENLSIDPDDIERCITENTKAIMVVHYFAYPADMDRIMEIARKHNLYVIEDVSHAQGGMYKGRRLGTIGDVAGISMMTGKSFAIGEGGMLITDDKEIYERAIALGSYERFKPEFIENEELKKYTGLPLGGYKFRMHQMSAAVGRVQLKYYDERCKEIRQAMNYFLDGLEGLPGIRTRRVDESTGSDMAGYYSPHILFVSEELGGLSVTRFCEAVRAEGYADCAPGCNKALHTHALFKTADVYGDGKPTRIANSPEDIRKFDENLEPAEKVGARVFCIPWFKKFRKEEIDQYIEAFKKVTENYKELLEGDGGNPDVIGGWHFFKHSEAKK